MYNISFMPRPSFTCQKMVWKRDYCIHLGKKIEYTPLEVSRISACLLRPLQPLLSPHSRLIDAGGSYSAPIPPSYFVHVAWSDINFSLALLVNLYVHLTVFCVHVSIQNMYNGINNIWIMFLCGASL